MNKGEKLHGFDEY